MIVYVAESGCYEDRRVTGIYDSLERAIAAHHQSGMIWHRELWHFKSPTRGGGMEETRNNKDWGDAVSICAMEVIDTGELRSPDHIVGIDDNSSGRGFDKLELSKAEADAISVGPVV